MHGKEWRKDPKFWGHWIASSPFKQTKYLEKKEHCMVELFNIYGYHPELFNLFISKLVIRVWLDFSLQYKLFLVCKFIEMWILLNMVILKAMSFPKKVCVLLHDDQGSIFLLLHRHCPCLPQVLPQAYAYKCN